MSRADHEAAAREACGCDPNAGSDARQYHLQQCRYPHILDALKAEMERCAEKATELKPTFPGWWLAMFKEGVG